MVFLELVVHAGLDQLVLDIVEDHYVHCIGELVFGPVHLLMFELVVCAGLDQLLGVVITKVVAGSELPGSSSCGLVGLNRVGHRAEWVVQRAELSSRTDVVQKIELGHGKYQGVGPLALLCSVYFGHGNFF